MHKLSSWSSYADKQTWALLGGDWRDKIVEALGEDKAENYFGNIVGWLQDQGEYKLAAGLKQAIVYHNARYECPSCQADLQYEPQTERWYCGAHGYQEGPPWKP